MPLRTQTSLDEFCLLPSLQSLHFRRLGSVFSILLLRSSTHWCLSFFTHYSLLQVIYEGTTSRSVNHVLILPNGKRFLQYARPDREINRLHTSPKLRQCPFPRIAKVPTRASSSPTLFDLSSFLCKCFLQKCVSFKNPKSWLDLVVACSMRQCEVYADMGASSPPPRWSGVGDWVQKWRRSMRWTH